MSSTNIVEQRIYQLLSSKFKVFNDIFGTSDSILGNLEDGNNLQNSIIEIYTKCRTIDEINKAFDLIQEQYKEVIDESIERTKKELLDNFDEDIQAYFADVLNLANQSVNKFELIFWNLTKIIMNGLTFDDSNRTFVLDNKKYCMSIKNDGGSIDYNMNTDLGLNVLKKASCITDKYGHIDFDITNYPYKITNIEELKGKSGYIAFSKVVIDSFEKEEHLIFNGILEDGTVIDEDTIEKLFRLETSESDYDIPSEIINSLEKDSELHKNKIVIESEEKNNALLNEEILKINKWAEDKIESTQLKVELMRNERKELQKQSDLAENTYEKEKLEAEIIKISKKIRNAWIELADAEDKIDEERRKMIKKLRDQLMKECNMESIFMVHFTII